MDLKAYFEEAKGLGVLATSDDKGRVDAAIYARPHIMDDGTIAFIMADRLSHSNLQSNPHAAYLFKEKGKGYVGVRLFITKTGEEEGSEKIESIRKRGIACSELDDKAIRFLVTFKVDKTLPLIGAGSEEGESS